MKQSYLILLPDGNPVAVVMFKNRPVIISFFCQSPGPPLTEPDAMPKPPADNKNPFFRTDPGECRYFFGRKHQGDPALQIDQPAPFFSFSQNQLFQAGRRLGNLLLIDPEKAKLRTR